MVSYKEQVRESIKKMSENKELYEIGRTLQRESIPYKYAHNFSWMGRPIIQEPQDIVAIQELIWKVRPDLIIDIGIAHGGSLVLCASILALLDIRSVVSNRRVLGIDIDIRQHNRVEIENHPVSPYIDMIEGSSVDDVIYNQVTEIASRHDKVMVFLDSNHTHNHVLRELELYAPLVSKDSYCVVFDTGIEDLPEGYCSDRPWGKGNNPKTAVWEYLKTHDEFVIEKELEHKLIITAAPDGYLRRVS